MREVNMLKRRDEGKGAIDFVDIDASTYDPEDNQGIEVSPARDPRISPAGIHSYLLTPCAASMTLPWAKSTPSCPTARCRAVTPTSSLLKAFNGLATVSQQG